MANNTITREDFFILNDKIDQLGHKVNALTLDVGIIKDQVAGNGHSGALENIDVLADRVSTLETTGAYHKGIFSISILGTIVLSGLTILNKIGII